MNVSKCLQRPILLIKAISLSAVNPLITLALFLRVLCYPLSATPDQETVTPRRFIDWCLNQTSLSPQTKHTVDVLLQVAGTQDCNQADKKLSILSQLDLNNNQIADLKPLSSLTNLTELDLSNNRIADLKPLSSLTNLTELILYNNQILTNKTCPVKPESICKFSPG